jgi:hypothetical protein
MIRQASAAVFISLLLTGTAVLAQPPKSYDLRTLNLVTPVKSQTGGTCWCHGTMSGIEGNLLMTKNWTKAGESGVPNMAEYHLDWWNGFNNRWNYDLYPDTADPGGVPLHNGGDYKIFTAYMSRLEGPIREQDAPGDGLGNNGAYAKRPALYSSTYHRWYAWDVNWYFMGDASNPLKNLDSIKNAVIKYGVLPTNYLVGSKFQGTWRSMVTHYQPPTDTGQANHSVAIVGWNDSALTPAGNTKLGAWLCKNSWGTTQSYFWISYYDKHCCRNSEMSVVSFNEVQALPFKNVYSLDYHGWRATLKTAKEAFNKFVAKRNEYLVAVSFFTTVDNEAWELKIYDNYTNGTLSGELASLSGSTTHIGYHTRNLDKPVSLKTGDDFYIYLKNQTGGQAYDRTSSPPVLTETPFYAPVIVRSKAAAGESYYRTSGTTPWIDFYTYDDTLDWDKTGNFCLKGFTIDSLNTGIGAAPASRPSVGALCMRGYPNPFSGRTAIEYTLRENSAASLYICNAAGKTVRRLDDAAAATGTRTVTWNGCDDAGGHLPSGVYYAVVQVKTGSDVRTERLQVVMLK